MAITLVNAAEMFVERLRLHQLAANRPIAQRPIADILRKTSVSFMCGLVTSIEVVRHTIDQDHVSGVREHAYILSPNGPNSAMVLRDVLPKLNRQCGRLLMRGGGATGIEATAEFAEAYPKLQVQLVTEGLFDQFTKKGVVQYMLHSLHQLGVTIQEQITISEVKANEVLTASGATLPHNVCLWAGGFTVPRLAREAGLHAVT